VNLFRTYGRAIVAVGTFLVAWLTASRTDGHISPTEWQILIVAGANAILVYVAPHYAGVKWIKPAVSVVLTVTAFLVAQAGTGGVHGSQWWTLTVLVLGALGVTVAPSRSVAEDVPVPAAPAGPAGTSTGAGRAAPPTYGPADRV